MNSYPGFWGITFQWIVHRCSTISNFGQPSSRRGASAHREWRRNRMKTDKLRHLLERQFWYRLMNQRCSLWIRIQNSHCSRITYALSRGKFGESLITWETMLWNNYCYSESETFNAWDPVRGSRFLTWSVCWRFSTPRRSSVITMRTRWCWRSRCWWWRSWWRWVYASQCSERGTSRRCGKQCC